jgi:L-lysine 6-transaminase
MVRARRILEVIEADALIERAAALGAHLLHDLGDLAARHPSVTDVRGRGLLCAFTLPSAELRDQVIARLRDDERVLVLGCGTASLRVRPALTVSVAELDHGIEALDRVLTALGA